MGWGAACMAGMCPNTWAVAGRKRPVESRSRKWRQTTSCKPTGTPFLPPALLSLNLSLSLRLPVNSANCAFSMMYYPLGKRPNREQTHPRSRLGRYWHFAMRPPCLDVLNLMSLSNTLRLSFLRDRPSGVWDWLSLNSCVFLLQANPGSIASYLILIPIFHIRHRNRIVANEERWGFVWRNDFRTGWKCESPGG